MGRLNRSFAVTTVNRAATGLVTDTRAGSVEAEEPLEIRVGGTSLLTTTRTPGNDIELAHGWLFGEGIISAASDVVTARYCAGAPDTGGRNTYNLLDITLAAYPLYFAAPMSNSCGISREQALTEVLHRAPAPITPLTLDAHAWMQFLDFALDHQTCEQPREGGCSAALTTAAAELVIERSDLLAAHAVDKLIGATVLADGVPARGHVLVLGARVTFDVARKAMMAGIPAIVTTSSVTSLAVELARLAGMTLICVVGSETVKVYAGAHPST